MYRSLTCLYLIFHLCCNAMIAQSHTADSLNSLLHAATSDTARLRYTYELAEVNKVSRIAFWDSINIAAKKLGSKHIEASSLAFLALAYRNQGNISKAADQFIASLKLFAQLGDKKGMASANNGLGIVYKNLGDTVKAVEYYMAALKLSEELGNKGEMSDAYNSLGIIERHRHNFSKALNYYFKSLALRTVLKDEYGIAEIYLNIGSLYKGMDDIEKAIDNYNKSYTIYTKLNDAQGMSYAQNYIASIYIGQKKFNEAEPFAKLSLENAQKTGFPKVIRNASLNLYRIYNEKGNYKDALAMHLLYIKMRDSINNQDLQEASIRSTMEFEYEKRAAADSVRTAKEKEVIAVQLKQEATQRYALYGGLALTLIFGGFIFNRFRITQRQKRIIEEQKKEVELKQKEIVDSIYYARRIQRSLLPPKVYIEKTLERLRSKK